MSKNKPLEQPLWGRIFQVLITWTVYFLFRPKVIYCDKSLKKRLRDKPSVFVCNHTHHFDGAFAGAVLGRFKPYVLVKRSWYDKKTVGTMISWCRSIPISLDEADGEWFALAEQAVAQGRGLIIFPEGGIARDGHMEQFKAGAALISARTGAQIVPCAIYGTYKPVFGMRQKILVGAPIESKCPQNMRHSKYARQLIAAAEADVKRLYGRLYKQYGDCGTYPQENFIDNDSQTV